MATILESELEQTRSLIFKMADLAIEAIFNAVRSLETSHADMARAVIDNDTVLDELEMQIDDECIKILVTKQPAATDLRLVLAMLKINTDLERIGDLAVNIAKETLRLNGRPTVKPLVDIPRMTEDCITIIKESFRAISEKDVTAARKAIEMDEHIDQLNMQIYRELFSYMAESQQRISEGLGLIMVSKALERIGDHGTNIAERAIYYIEGVDIRHGNE